MIFDIDHFAVHDGPGIRTCIYFKGCPLRCRWCHSPESQERKVQVLFAPGRCLSCGICVKECPYGCQRMDEEGDRTFFHDACKCCGACLKTCPGGAMFLCGKRMQVDEVIQEIMADRVFFQNSNGGVTLSGGEVLMQAGFANELLKSMKELGIHTIIETSGYGRTKDLLLLAESADQFYYDFKLSKEDAFYQYTGGNLSVVLDNLAALRQITDAIVLRIPLIPGITDTEDNVLAAYETAKKFRIKEIHLLPYNMAAAAKYEWVGRIYEPGMRYTDPDHNAYLMSMAPAGIDVTIMN